MARKKEMLLVVDIETCGGITEPLAYDIGYAVCDRNGNIYLERSFIVAETFLDLSEEMATAYYASKIPEYWESIKKGERMVKGLMTIRKQMLSDMKHYNVHKVGAYNASFDRKGLNNTIRYVTKSRFRWFFPFDTEYFCIWNMACQTLMNTTTYAKFAMRNGLQSEKGNLQTSAEACYKYITQKLDFEEEHKGLEDVRIEVAIMGKCNATHKKINRSINTQCWRIPQKKRKKACGNRKNMI